MIKIDHVAVWANDIETLKAFYENFFGAEANAKYTNEKKQFQSYFLMTFLRRTPGANAATGSQSERGNKFRSERYWVCSPSHLRWFRDGGR